MQNSHPDDLTFHPGSPAISMNYAHMLVILCQKRGVDERTLLKGTGLNREDLTKTDSFATLIQFRLLVNRALQLTRDPALGLAFGNELNIASHGFLGYAIMSSKHPLDAFAKTQKYLKIRNRLVTPDISLSGDRATLSLKTALKDGPFKRFMLEHAFASLQQSLGFLTGVNLHIEQFSFNFDAPEYTEKYANILKAKVIFNAPDNRVTLTGNNFKELSSLADPTLSAIAEKHCEALLNTLDRNTPLPFLIRQLILETSGQFPPLDYMASQLSMSPRTLSRQLKQQQTSYQEIIDEMRCSKACEYLSTTHWRIDEIAELLDYNDPANFRRAFKKWMGQTPARFRASLET